MFEFVGQFKCEFNCVAFKVRAMNLAEVQKILSDSLVEEEGKAPEVEITWLESVTMVSY